MAVERFVVTNKVIDGIFLLTLLFAGLSVWGPDWWQSFAVVNNMPWLYDLSLAYVTGWIFNLLVVELPQRQARKRLLSALGGPLRMFAINGGRLIQELEYFGRCPTRSRVTYEHVEKVMRANSQSALPVILQRAALMHRIYEELAPYLTLLDLELVVQLQRTKKTLEVLSVDRSYAPTTEERHRLRDEQFAQTMDGPERMTLVGWTKIVFAYYQACEATQTILHRLDIEADRGSGAGDTIFFPEMLFAGREVVRGYPPEALP